MQTNDDLKVTDALWNEIQKKKSPEGNRKATGLNIEYPIMELLLSIAETHKVSKSAILRCFMRDGLDLIKKNNEVNKMGYDGMGHYTSMLEPSILDSSEVISKASKATKSNVMRHCVLLGLRNYLEINRPYTEEEYHKIIKNIPENDIIKPNPDWVYPKPEEKGIKPDELERVNNLIDKHYSSDIDPKKPQTEEDLQRTIEESNFAEPLPVESKKESSLDANIQKIEKDDLEKSDFDKFMDKAVESMKDMQNSHKIKIDVTFNIQVGKD